MGCFVGCFGGCKDSKRRRQRKKVIPRDQSNESEKPFQATVSLEQSTPEKHANPVSELRDKSEEQLSSSTQKRVTFDSNVTTYEHVSSVYESTESLQENDKVNWTKAEETRTKSRRSSSLSEDDSTISSVGSYPPNHRYQNCRDSDNELEEELDYEGSDLEDEDEEYGDYDDDVHDRIVCQNVWSESIPAESMESRTEVSSTEALMGKVQSPMTMYGLPDKDMMQTVDLKRNPRDRSGYVYPVLNPVENLTQWKAVKSKGANLKPQKENNLNADLEQTNIKQALSCFKPKCDQHKKNPNHEIAVDASLSTWLDSSETTPTLPKKSGSEKSMSQGSQSITNFDDRPILGALTVEELKQLSASSSSLPRRSPSKSPDEMAIIGTVGTYWNNSRTSVEHSCGSASTFKRHTRYHKQIQRG